MAEHRRTNGPESRSARRAGAAWTAARWLGLDEQLTATLIGESDGPHMSEEAGAAAPSQLVEAARTLRRLVRNRDLARRWLNGPNAGLGMRPIELLQQPGGLQLLHDYLGRFGPR